MIQRYVSAAEDKKVQKPNTASYDAILAARGDPLLIPKLQFFLSIARSFNPFLQKYQTDEPVLPFLAKDLTELLLSLLRRFIKRELLQDQTPLQLIKLDISDEKNWVSLKRVDIGLGAESAIKAFMGKPGTKIGEHSVLSLRNKCLQCLVQIIKKLQERSPLKFPIVRQIACLDPTKMAKDPEWCIVQMKALVQTFIQGQQLAGGVAAGDVIIQQFYSFLSDGGRDEEFVSFQPLSQRLDVFLHSRLCTSHPDLLKFCQSALLPWAGHMNVCGGVLNVPLSKELLASAGSSRSQYRLHLESERKKRESATQELKRKTAEKELEDLRNQQQVLHSVCHSLESDANKFAEMAEGYHPKNDRLIVTLCSGDSSVEPPEERRGKHAGKKMDLSKIYQPIESFHPTISHYRRSHAPNRRYLPSDITIKSMYDDFKQNNRCSYETYRKAINNLNIGFTKLGEEECEVCLRHNIHMKQHEVVSTAGGGCETCQKWEVHHYHAIRGREHYRMDAEKEEEVHSVVRSVDLQKVIMLPRMPGVKTAVFTRRISAFHETFATVGKMSSKEKRAMSVIWHEGIAGRSAVEVTSAYVTCLSLEGVQHVTYWVDNCTSQNKNWVLISTLVKIVNSDQNTITDITLKFFEPGHTFMSADSFHASVERMMKKRPGGVVLDFQEFRDVIASSNSGRVNVVELQSSNILAWTDDHSAAKMKNEAHLADMAVIQVRRGSRRFFYKLEHDAEDFTGCDFLKTKATLDFPPQLRPGDKGVEKEKKREIISKLVPLMPESRRQFWVALAEEE
ncbi:hypothetical protein ACEWY4_028042 [Coilia grayii]|uniref:Uncharacterized protein n=1 Tax=Coilia grayii TaxID=363190 RepID=A0ABD1IQR4_9TELE